MTLGPTSPLGLALGVAAAMALLLTMLYSVRRGAAGIRVLGPTQWYLQIHLWAGAAFLILFVLHTGVREPQGVLSLTLWVVSLWVVVTGAVGLVLQRIIPRLLESASSFEVHLRRVPELIEELKARAQAAAGRAEPRVRAYYEQRLAPEMDGPRMLGAALLQDPRMSSRATGDVEILRRTLPAEGVAALEELRELRASKHELDVHYTLQRILRGWLYLHLPVAIVLLGLVALHVFLVFYF